MDNRQFPRFPYDQPVGYHRGFEAPDNGSVAADISAGGVRIRVQEFIPLRTVLDLKIHLNNPSRTVPVRGQVVWVREVPYSEVFDIGVQFLEELRGITTK